MLSLTNARVNLFQGTPRLAADRNGTIQVAEGAHDIHVQVRPTATQPSFRDSNPCIVGTCFSVFFLLRPSAFVSVRRRRSTCRWLSMMSSRRDACWEVDVVCRGQNVCQIALHFITQQPPARGVRC